jgi:hypothetical protein
MIRTFRTYSPFSYFIRLFSRFTISAIAQQYIRVSSATLEIKKDEQGLSIFGTLSQTREIIVRSTKHGITGVTQFFLDYHPYASRTLFV